MHLIVANLASLAVLSPQRTLEASFATLRMGRKASVLAQMARLKA
jgi:hypothetical protein